MSTTTASVFDRLLAPVADCLTPEVAGRIAGLRADAATQRRLQELGEKANEGLLSDDERAEYSAYVDAIDLISILQSKARAVLPKPAMS